MSVFNPEVFLNQTTQKALQTNRTPIPSDEYVAVVDSVEAGVTSKKGLPYLYVYFKIIGDGGEMLKTKFGFRDPKIRRMFMLDFDEAGTLDDQPNKNVDLGKLRDTLDQNRAGEPWAPSMLVGGGPIKIQVTQRPEEDNPAIIYNDVRAFAKLT